jgi:selenium donor protein
MQVPREYALGTIRFSTGRMTTAEEIRMALDIIGDRVKTSGSSNISVGTTDGIRQEARSTSADLEEEGKEPGGITETETSSAVRGSGIRLTAYTRSLGCACKIRPQGLENILASIPKPSDRRIIVGTETRDDAAVFLITEDKAIIQTVDFIPPVADDPYVYGAIAAANALSDVWAMGGKPLFALSVLAFPEKILPPEVLEKILKGASDKVSEAGISIIGGHSIDDEEPKFGLVVSGEAKPGRIWRNATPRAGDALILTKPLGSGIISTAVKKGFASEQDAMGAVQVMMDLNMKAAGVLLDFEVHACTDVTGFGLLGHLVEMLGGGSLDAVLEWEKIPLLEGTRHYALSGMVPGGTLSNLEFVRPSLKPAGSIPHEVLLILADAQTSGGLLVSVSASHVEEIRRRFVSEGLPCFAYIGSILQGSGSIGII